jgi:penicillin-binding protein 2
VFDYVLNGTVPSEEDMALTREGKSTTPVGKPRPASEVLLPGAAAIALPPAVPATQRVAQGVAQGVAAK